MFGAQDNQKNAQAMESVNPKPEFVYATNIIGVLIVRYWIALVLLIVHIMVRAWTQCQALSAYVVPDGLEQTAQCLCVLVDAQEMAFV